MIKVESQAHQGVRGDDRYLFSSARGLSICVCRAIGCFIGAAALREFARSHPQPRPISRIGSRRTDNGSSTRGKGIMVPYQPRLTLQPHREAAALELNADRGSHKPVHEMTVYDY